MSRTKQLKLTTIYSVSLIMFLIGLGYARMDQAVDIFRLAIVPLGLLAIVFKNRKLTLICLSISFFVLGWYRGVAVMKRLDTYQGLIGSNVTIRGSVLDDAVYSDRSQLEFGVGAIELVQPTQTALLGEMAIEGSGLPMVYKGDRLLISGRLYKKRGGQVAGISFARLNLLSKSKSPIEPLRRRFSAGMQDILPEQLASFGLGLLIGQRTTLNEQLEKDLITVGLIHIVAVSGYNLTIIIELVRKLMKRRSRFQSVIFSLSLIMVFLLFTGFAPSILRAAIVSSLSLLAWFFGRSIKPSLLLIGTAALTAGVNPLYIWSNIGWYLSFTSFFGVLILGPLINQFFLPGKLQENLILATLSETVSAQICTLPIILYIFGRLSIVSVFANVLVVPLTPIAMLLSFLSGMAGMINFNLSNLIAWPARAILDYMLTVSEVLSRVPHANVEIHLTTIEMISLNLLIIAFAVILKVKIDRKSAIITEIEE